MSELKAIRSGEIYNIIEYEDCYRTDDLYYPKSEVDAAIDELKAKLESVQATAYAESVDAGMENRRLKRALYKACANWAKFKERINCMNAYDASEYLHSMEDIFRKKAERWSEMERKCRAKAEEYK